MQVILLERIPRLGQMGDEVRVKDGFARNFLLPRGKALRSNEANRKRFESQRSQLEARNLQARQEAEAVAEKLEGQTVVMIRSAGERGQLYGSVATRDIAMALTEAGFSVGRSQVNLNSPIKELGLFPLTIQLHPEVTATVTINVARTADEAERQARGEDLTQVENDYVLEAGEGEEFEEEEGGEEADEQA
ncbi:50S ribosomal protein L9 [Lutibaculum baratangense]|uniref:Large ribosomal subunit protein bL9 n=1 Tax=Lutibaculum baratangense AMV1 TaxID=631454 RepID=V4RPM9_9HYPH|nr:50S ribosomal protein L9 [Lutibaculum baratangense]ESR27239.1 LSU ribosomal protein L9p [Lutibaculum baratangense AMV1]